MLIVYGYIELVVNVLKMIAFMVSALLLIILSGKFNDIGYVLGLSDQRPSHDFSTITYVLQLYGDQRVMANRGFAW